MKNVFFSVLSVLERIFELDPIFETVDHFLLYSGIQILFSELLSAFFPQQYNIRIIDQQYFDFPSVFCRKVAELLIRLFVVFLMVQIFQVFLHEGAPILQNMVQVRFGAVHRKHSI